MQVESPNGVAEAPPMALDPADLAYLQHAHRAYEQAAQVFNVAQAAYQAHMAYIREKYGLDGSDSVLLSDGAIKRATQSSGG